MRINFIVREGRGSFRRGRSRRGVHKGCSRRGGHSRGCSRRGFHSGGTRSRRRQVDTDARLQRRERPGGKGQGSTATQTARAAITTTRQGRLRRPHRRGGHHSRKGGHNSCQGSHSHRKGGCMRNGIWREGACIGGDEKQSWHGGVARCTPWEGPLLESWRPRAPPRMGQCPRHGGWEATTARTKPW